MSEAQGLREDALQSGQTGQSGSAARERPIGRRTSDRIVGVSNGIQRAIEQAAAASRSATRPVVVVGPSGCGKTHLARAIHAWSERAAGRFEVVPIGSVQEGLQAREIFGSVGGGNPVAPEAHEGALARAAGGTVVLKGLDAARGDVRAALARAIASGSFRPEGGSAATPLGARVIGTATTGDGLLAETAAQVIELAPLAERAEDVLPLAAHFLAEFAREAGVTPVGFTSDARRSLEKESWDGNVRELRERIRGAVRLAGSGAITAEALLLAIDGEEIPSFKEAKRAFETRYVEGLLRRCAGNISRAARLAKKDRKDFYDVIRRTGVDPTNFRG